MNTLNNIHSSSFVFPTKLITPIFLLFFTNILFAQLSVTTERASCVYQAGETARFNVQSNSNGEVSYQIRYDKYTSNLATGSLNLSPGQTKQISYTHNGASAVQCFVYQNGQASQATAVFSPYYIDESIPEPGDFDQFWNQQKSLLASVPMNPQLSFHASTPYSTTYKVNLGHIDNRRVYGYISIPAGAGPFPAILSLPSFGESNNLTIPETSFSEQMGAISMNISIHNADPQQIDPNAYSPDVIDNRNQYYHRYSVLAAVRAIDYIYSRSEFDGQNLGVNGISQGGGLGIMVAGIDNRVKAVAASIPGLCGHGGLSVDEASGFPYYVLNSINIFNSSTHTQATVNASGYFDAINFAKRFKGPAFIGLAYEDLISPPPTVFAAINQMSDNLVITHATQNAHVTPSTFWGDSFKFFRRVFPSLLNTNPWPWPSSETGYRAYVGEDLNVSTGQATSLAGNVYLNNNAINYLPVSWEKVSGPGNVSFSGSNTYNPTVTINTPGTYVLRFIAKNNQQQVNSYFHDYIDFITINVGGGNVDPCANQGGDSDNDNICNFQDNCPNAYNPNQADSNNNGIGDACETIIEPPTDNCNNPINVALNKSASQSQTLNISGISATANKAVDGNTSGNFWAGSVSATNNGYQGWWQVDLGETHSIKNIKVYNRTEGSDRLNNYHVMVSNSPFSNTLSSAQNQSVWKEQTFGQAGSPSNYTLNASGRYVRIQMEGSGYLTLAEVEVFACTEDSTNPGTDNTAPTVSLSTNNLTVSSNFDVNVSFNESVSGLTPNDFSISNGYAVGLTGSGQNYTLQVSPYNYGTVGIQLADNRATDAAGNGNTFSNYLNVTYGAVNNGDVYQPGVSVYTSSYYVDGPYQVNIQFTEAVTGLTLGDFNVYNGTLSNLTGTGNFYRVLVTPTSSGPVSIELPSNSVQDLAGNGNYSSNFLTSVNTGTNNFSVYNNQLDFNASKNGRAVKLNWVTNTEFKNIDFTIERSSDNENFEAILQLPSTGEGFDLANYDLLDHFPLEGVNYYRLKQTYFDGEFDYSDIKTVDFDLNLYDVALFPNPALDKISLDLGDYQSEKFDIIISDNLGRVLFYQNYDSPLAPLLEFDLDNYRAGVYILTIAVENGKEVNKKFVVGKY